MARKPVVLNDEIQFSSKQDANQFYAAILNSCALNEPLPDEQFAFVEALLLNHPRADAKIGPGIQKLLVASAGGGGRCFHVLRSDGTIENFSIAKCLNGDSTWFTQFREAARKSVATEITACKDLYFAENANAQGMVRCPATGEWIDYHTAHVDHRPPMTFSMIARGFLAAKRWMNPEFDPAEIHYDRNGTYGARFADEDLASEFAEYHRREAVLRVIKATTNLSRAHLGRIALTRADRVLHAGG